MPQGPGLLLTFLYYFSTATLIADLVLAQQLQMGLNDRSTLQLSLFVGIMTGLLGLYMNRSRTLNFTVGSQRRFASRLEAALEEMGFDNKENAEGYSIYSHRGWQRWFAGKILVKIERQAVTITSRADNIRQLAPKVDQQV
ncbi:MAG: hypothetical protein AAGG51_24750 [Cyanobacteria bacterium P01_G01_bin.54]